MKNLDSYIYEALKEPKYINLGSNRDDQILSKIPQEFRNLPCVIRVLDRFFISSTTCPPYYDNICGNFLSPKFVLIGEAPGKPSPLDKTYPFLSTSGSSRWLNDQLDSIEIPEVSLFFANALDWEGNELNPEWIERPLSSAIKVFALGNIASNWCKKHKIDAVKVPHPQYWKRFRSKEPYPLVAEIKQIL